MKKITPIMLALIALVSCNRREEQQQMQATHLQDSVLKIESAKKDSTITEYVKSMNDIQDNLDKIKTAEKMLSVNAENVKGRPNAVQDIKNINNLLLKYHKEIYTLENKLKAIDVKNKEVDRMQAHLAEELAEKDSGITVLQKRLAGTNDSLKMVMQQFNDSLVVINNQKGTISEMTNEMHTVYYTVGTMKDLKKTGVVSKEGGFAGIGRTTAMNQDVNNGNFVKGDMTQITVIPLNKRFEKIITTHPTGSYTVTNNSKNDSLIIKDQTAFWSKSKYLIVAVK